MISRPFFFTNFSDNFGAYAMLRSFQYYGDATEVVIPAKRGIRGGRFGFVRFAYVTDIRRFETELDSIIFGRDKISVNVSRFNRAEDGIKTSRNLSRKENGGVRREENIQINRGIEQLGAGETQHHFQKPSKPKTAISDMEKLQQAFVGIVKEPDMAYNIQNSFHRQGYFGVKVTPLGANLCLLQGQDEGEVQALIEDAKDWLDQWFKEIKPWDPKDIDVERTIWLRIYGIPSHAWNEVFFAQLVKPWGTFVNEDEGALKKITMDVARLMICTSSTQVIDEFIDVKVNGVIFHLRVLEDSYGPMRIMVTQNQRQDGRDDEVSEDEEEEEELAPGLWAEEEVAEREAEDQEETPLTITTAFRKQQKIIRGTKFTEEVSSGRGVIVEADVVRNPPIRGRSNKKPSNSLSSVGTILCCSSLGSSDIRNCNRRFIEKHDYVTAQKVWEGAVEQGVVGAEKEDCYIFKIQLNEKNDEWKEKLLYIVNIYSPCSWSGKHKLWQDLLDFKLKNDNGEWCLGGDFNVISNIGERHERGSVGSHSERREFSAFMEAFEVIDIPVLGKQFTWFNSDCSAMSRLDHFLLSDGFIHHTGKKAFILKEKLKQLKEALRKWNKQVFGFTDLGIDNTVKELNEVEDLTANADVDPSTLNSKDLVPPGPHLGDPGAATSRPSPPPSLVEFLPSVGIEPRTLGFKYVFNPFPLPIALVI
ncbi:hypothetical protein TSUD_184080 [Trifolium subterraneum]|uniref:Uncharacterized protein n=1 Tax=Trifolium subterraneum TaxID=3900 RepID=A0A2Z6NVL1_TRISU|nr:hypothetical protein TSUD_184080 [Trifolium subterraneum]